MDYFENGILDINKMSSSPDALSDFLKNNNYNKEANDSYLISNKTHHGWDYINSYDHKAYSDYVASRIDALNEKYNISQRLETQSMEELRKELVKSGEMKDIRRDILELNHELRKANRDGIDLYLTNDGNIKNKDYTKGGTVSKKDAMEEFNKQFDDEKNKSNACGGIK